jgi:hypothetical protein
MAVISATLDWGGVWEIKQDDIPTNVPDEEGIYMIICGRRSTQEGKWDTSSYKLLYIGEANNVRSRIDGHEKWPCWKQNCSNYILLKVASCNLGTTRRQKVECCLIYRNKPICNDECKHEFPYEDDVEITNTGMYSPLSSKHTC